MSSKKITYGRTTAADRGTIVTHEGTWPEIAELFRDPLRRKITQEQYAGMSPKNRAHSKNTGLFFGGKCDNGHRGDNTLVSRSMVNLDLDDHCAEIWADYMLLGTVPALDGLAYLIHSTRSSTSETPKFRIWLPLSREVSPAEYEPVARGIAEMLDASMMAVARESYTPAQGMYLPSVSSDQDYYFSVIEGSFFNPDRTLNRYPADDASTWPRKPKEQVTEYVPGRKMTHPEDKKALAPIIAAVHRAFDPHDFITEFLGDVYLPAGDRYSIVSASGAPSVRVYDDAFIHSDHGSDPAVGQHNTFDLGRIHLFGDLDADFETDAMFMTEWPSYKAMSAFMLEHDEVREALAQIEIEIEEERNGGMLDLLADLDDEEPEPDEPEPEEDDDDDLIGRVKPAKKKTKTIEDVLKKVKASIARAKSLDDLERRLEIIRGFPTTDFRDLHRDLVAPDIQRKFKELTGESITKAVARKMLASTIENLRKQVEGLDVPAWLDPWVYISSTNTFLNLDTKQVLPKDGFNGLYSGEAGEEHGTNNNGTPKVLPSDLAQSVYMLPKPYTIKFHPDKPALFEEDSVLYVNTYRAAHPSSGGYKGKAGVKLLLRLLVDLFPDEIHQHMVLDFIAHCVRYPGKKLKYALLIKGCENEGKSLFAELIKKLLGTHNCMTIGNEQLTEKFNAWAFEKLFCTVEEIKIVGKEAYEVLNKLKPVITNPEIPIRRMRTDASHELNFCNLYITTNFEDCLPLEDDNTRFLVLFTRFLVNAEVKAWHAELKKTEGSVYTRELWDHIQERPAQFLEFFAKYEFSEAYDPDGGRAPDTVFKRIMAEDGKNEERVLLDDMLESEENPTITSEIFIWANFRAILDSKDLAPNLRNRAVGSFLKPLGFIKAKPTTIRIGGDVRKTLVWTRNSNLINRNAENMLTQEGRDKAKAAMEAVEALDDGEDLRSNVIQMQRKNRK
jgi:hypothetical protein